MALKLFKSQVFDSVNDLLQWLDTSEDQVVIVNIAGTAPFTVTYAEGTAPRWRSGLKTTFPMLRPNSVGLVD